MEELLSDLEVKGFFCVGKYDKLIEIMRDAGVEIGIDEIQKTAEDIKGIMQNGIPSQEQSETSSQDAHTSDQDSIHPSPVPGMRKRPNTSTYADKQKKKKITTRESVSAYQETSEHQGLGHEEDNIPVQMPVQGPSQVPLYQTDLTSVQRSLIESYKDIRTIQLNPAFREKVGDITDYYIDMYPVVEEVREKNREDGPQNMKEKKTKSLKQLFFKDKDDSKQSFQKGSDEIIWKHKFNRIVLKAEPGIGKSTFCRRLVDIWCTFQERRFQDSTEKVFPSESSSAGMKDGHVMLMFDILLYLNLGEISNEKEFIDVIYAQIPLLKSKTYRSRVDLTTIMDEVENNRVLLIMDGLDEMGAPVMYIEQILKRKLYPFVTVVVSSRPWKIGQMGLSQPAHIDLLINLEGFNENNSMSFAKKIFDIDYNDKSAMKEFEQSIKKVNIFKSLIHAPLLMLFLVHVWYRKRSFPDTLHQLYFEMLDVLTERYIERKQNVSISCQEVECSSELKEFPKLQELIVTKTFGKEFLLDFCEIANYFLFGKKRENSLIFEERAFLEKLGKDGNRKLQRLLDIGLLSKQDCTTTGDSKRNIRLSFPHKTIQEFLAAIYICCKEKQFDQFLETLKTYDSVLQNETIITFLAGISPQRCEEMFEKIFEACADDDKIYDKTFWMIVSSNQTPILQLYMNCLQEASEKLHLRLRHLHANNLQDLNTILSTMKSASDIRILTLNGIDFTLNQCQFQFDISQCSNLKYLLLHNINMLQKNYFSNAQTSLRVVHLCKITLSSENACLLCDTLLKCTQLEKLTFDEIYVVEGKLDTSRVSPSLCAFTLDETTISSDSDVPLHHGVPEIPQELKKYLNPQESQLKQSNQYKVRFYISSYSNLKYLKLKGIHLEHAKFAFPCLCQLHIEEITISSENYVQLWDSLSQCTQLIGLTVDYINVVDSKLDMTMTSLSRPSMENVTNFNECAVSLCSFLSKQTKLLKVTLANVNFFDATLNLSAASSLSILSLDNVTMNNESAVLLCNSLSNFQDLYILKLIDIDLKDALFKLSNVKKELVLDMENILISSQSAEELRSFLSDFCVKKDDMEGAEHQFLSTILTNPFPEGTQVNLSQTHSFLNVESYVERREPSGRYRCSVRELLLQEKT